MKMLASSSLLKITSLRLDAHLEEHVSSVRLMRSPAKKSKKGGTKGSVALLKVSF